MSDSLMITADMTLMSDTKEDKLFGFGTRPKRRPAIYSTKTCHNLQTPFYSHYQTPTEYRPSSPPTYAVSITHTTHTSSNAPPILANATMPLSSFPFDYNYSPLPTKSKNTVIPPVHNSAARQPLKPHRYSPPPRFKPPPKFQATLVPSGQTLRQSTPVMNSSSQTPQDTPKSKPPDPTPVSSWFSIGAIPKQASCRSLSSRPPSEIFSDDVYISDSEDTDEYETCIPELRNKAANENELFRDQTLGSVRITGSVQDPRLANPNDSNVSHNI